MQQFIQSVKSFVAWEWIGHVTKSLFKLASYIVELPMVASGVYIMIATGIPGANNPHWYNLAFGVLLSAPEVLAPGAFFRAESMQSRGKLKVARVTRWIAGFMLFFAALTFSSVMIFHFSNEWLQAIMFCRVMTALGYSIITRIDMDHGAMPVQPPALQPDYWPLVAMAAHLQSQFEAKLAELASTQKTMQAEFQAIDTSIQTVDYDALTQAVLTHLKADFDAWKQAQIDALPEAQQPQLDAPKPASKRASKSQNDASKKILTLRQPSASTTDKKTVIHGLLAQDLSLTSYYLASQAHCSEATARRIKNEYIDARSDASGDASETIVLTPDAMRHDA